jgi:hypothetical protein
MAVAAGFAHCEDRRWSRALSGGMRSCMPGASLMQESAHRAKCVSLLASSGERRQAAVFTEGWSSNVDPLLREKRIDAVVYQGAMVLGIVPATAICSSSPEDMGAVARDGRLAVLFAVCPVAAKHPVGLRTGVGLSHLVCPSAHAEYARREGRIRNASGRVRCVRRSAKGKVRSLCGQTTPRFGDIGTEELACRWSRGS